MATSRNSLGPIGLIHNGADDNASGVAGLLEVAEAISASCPSAQAVDPVRVLGRRGTGLLGSQALGRESDGAARRTCRS